MKFGQIASVLHAASQLLHRSASPHAQRMEAISDILSKHPELTVAAFKKNVTAVPDCHIGAGLTELEPFIEFFSKLQVAKHEKALIELFALSKNAGIRNPEDLISAASTAMARNSKKRNTKSSKELVMKAYLDRLNSAGSYSGGIGAILQDIELDKNNIGVTELRQIASQVTGVKLSKSKTRAQYMDDLRAKFIVLDREESKRALGPRR